MAVNIKSFFFATIALVISVTLLAGEAPRIHDSIYIVVITDDEGIHYAGGCAFYDLRDLLAASEEYASTSVDLTDDPLFEVRALGKSGNTTAYVGDHWMRTSAGTALLPTKTFKRITELVQMRKGSGVRQSIIEASIRQVSKRIQDPIYVEENKCKNPM